jgi:hypothetical protein
LVEEPERVEVAIIQPEMQTRPAQKLDIEDLPHWKGPTEIPAYDYELWGDPIGWVDAAGLRFLVGIVSRFDSHHWSQLEDGPYIETDDAGRYFLRTTVREDANKEAE